MNTTNSAATPPTPSTPAQPTTISFLDEEDTHRVVVEWIMSSVCNYTCSYCPDSLHDGQVHWPPHSAVVDFCRRVSQHYTPAPTTFLLSGGEITLFPGLRALAREMKSMGAQVAILTNGSRSRSWWTDMVDHFDEVIISYHHERADPTHVLAVLRFLTERTRVQVNVVVDPAAFDQVMTFAATAEAQTTATVNRKIMFLDGWKRPATYTAGQRRRLAVALAGQRVMADTVLKGGLVLGRVDGTSRVVSPLQLINEGLNHWEGWDCEIGQTTLLVRFDQVWRAACRVGGPVGSIYDRDLQLPTDTVRCTSHSCTCIAGIKAAKSRPPHTAPAPDTAVTAPEAPPTKEEHVPSG